MLYLTSVYLEMLVERFRPISWHFGLFLRSKGTLIFNFKDLLKPIDSERRLGLDLRPSVIVEGP
jgi:hypothetical protein